MNILQIDRLNTLLILISFVFAYIFPFELFVLSYAILGPLHYLTEINWIKDKNYFINSKKWIYFILFFTLIIAIPGILRISFLDSLKDIAIFKILRYQLPKYTNHIFFLSLVIAFSLLFWKQKKQQLIVIAIGFLIAFLLHQFKTYHVIIGILLPTLIHVYLFTILFMWYGNLKDKSTINYFNIFLMLAIPLILIVIDIDNTSYHFSETIKTIISTNFYKLNVTVLNFFGIEYNNFLFFNEMANLKIQIFIAFAYTYHYLNWFSKTTVIGWHKKITKKKSILICIFWVLAVSLYFYDYATGLAVLLFLSLLHVVMEFPLNILCIKAIIKNHQ
ncbi:hypothetical protein [Flavobacterium sp. J27]|uniref:hypothetical protein n=1 Tax=Flavobacterium sp. J27 TaxID=2060419 RepID=UPI0010304AB9|nr:hypothetical protein [Flavobacterium sp. J27]